MQGGYGMDPMMFWGVEVKPGRPMSMTLQDNEVLHVSMASFGAALKGKERSAVQLTVNGDTLTFCVLVPGVTESFAVDLNIWGPEEVEFTVTGNNAVHLTGNMEFPGDNSDDGDAEGMLAELGAQDSDEDSDEDSDAVMDIASKGPKIKQLSDDDEEEETKKPRQPRVAIPDQSDDDSEDDDDDDDDEDDDDDDDESDVPPPRPKGKTGKNKAPMSTSKTAGKPAGKIAKSEVKKSQPSPAPSPASTPGSGKKRKRQRGKGKK